jgi:hypothetical protein
MKRAEIKKLVDNIKACEACRSYSYFPKLCGDCCNLMAKTNGGAEVPCNVGLVAMQAEAKQFIDANVWDGEDRSGATNDRATFNPDELQELIDDMLEHMSN